MGGGNQYLTIGIVIAKLMIRLMVTMMMQVNQVILLEASKIFAIAGISLKAHKFLIKSYFWILTLPCKQGPCSSHQRFHKLDAVNSFHMFLHNTGHLQHTFTQITIITIYTLHTIYMLATVAAAMWWLVGLIRGTQLEKLVGAVQTSQH